MKNRENLKIFWHYIREDKLKLFLYIFLVALSYFPSLISVYFWGIAIEALTVLNFNRFFFLLVLYESIHILAYSFLQTPFVFLSVQIECYFLL